MQSLRLKWIVIVESESYRAIEPLLHATTRARDSFPEPLDFVAGRNITTASHKRARTVSLGR